MDADTYTQNVLLNEPSAEQYLEDILPRLRNDTHVEEIFTLLCRITQLSSMLDQKKKQIFYGQKNDFKLSNHMPVMGLSQKGKVAVRDGLMKNIRLAHGAIGLVTETGEILEAFLDTIERGLTADVRENFKEELGDVQWYSTLIADELDWPDATIKEHNVSKLKKRYNEGSFSGEQAAARADKQEEEEEEGEADV